MEGGLDMSFLFDIHIHTEESSKCGETSAAKVVERYKKLGYDGLCITDHMNKPNSAVFGNT
ncbi:MAG: PHP domain-containing protein, partial [Clostridia bacterium]|nr:PHP domain-containing protein [Clostridia bacterium]